MAICNIFKRKIGSKSVNPWGEQLLKIPSMYRATIIDNLTRLLRKVRERSFFPNFSRQKLKDVGYLGWILVFPNILNLSRIFPPKSCAIPDSYEKCMALFGPCFRISLFLGHGTTRLRKIPVRTNNTPLILILNT